MTAVTARERLSALLTADRPDDPATADRPLVDIGSSVVTGIRDRRARAAWSPRELVGHPVAQTRVVTAAGAATIGSDCVRAGRVHLRPELDADDTFVDQLGVRWLWADGEPTPLEHPFAEDGRAALRRPMPAQVADVREVLAPDPSSTLVVVVDPPVAGLVEQCFALRGQWCFLTDVVDDRPLAAALLDRALETAVSGYEALLQALPAPPDVLLYRDELGFGESMYLGGDDFRDLVAPRMGELIGHLRALAPSAVALAVTGAVAPVLPVLAGFGVDLLNVEHDARGMDPAGLRRALPARTLLHGVTDLVTLGRAIAVRDLATVANELFQFARCWPAVVAPVGSMALAELADAVSGAVFLSTLTGEDVALVRRAGPVRSILERCLAAVATSDVDAVPAAVARPMTAG